MINKGLPADRKDRESDPFLSDHLFLFHSGADCRAYEFLGAHAGERGGAQGVWFRVWAPGAEAVHVTGDFCAWSADAYPMRRVSDGVWEAFCEGVGEYAMYKYLICTGDGRTLSKCDPYAFHTETRPLTASKVCRTDGFEWSDAEWMAARAAWQPHERPVSIYEVHLGSWRRNEDGGFYNYERMADELIPYALEMGYTHIELLPVMEHPLDMSWGYQCLGYFAPTSRFGKPADFMRLIDRCHGAGLGVILDWVPAHFPKDDFGLAEFDGTPLYEGGDRVRREHPSWGTLIFDYGRGEVRSFLMSSATYWLERFHADGFRIDAVASMLYLDFCREPGQWRPNRYGGRENLEAMEFLRALNTAVFRDFPGIMMMAEESSAWPMVTKPVYLGGLGFNFKWNMGWMNDMLSYVKQDPVFRQYHHNLITFSLTYAFAENYVLPLSHDEVVHLKGSLIGKMPGSYEDKFSGLRTLLGYMFAHPGKKLLFMGGELAQFAEWNWAGQLDWFLLDFEKHAAMRRYVSALNRFYKDNPPLWEQDADWSGFSWISCENAAQNIVVLRRSDRQGAFLIAVVNFAPVMREGYRIGLPEAGRYAEAFSSDDTDFGGWGVRNADGLITDSIPWNGQQYSAVLTVPPLGVAFFAREEGDSKQEAADCCE